MEQQILKILSEVCDESLDNSMDLDLFAAGYLDSLAVAELIVNLEDALNIKIPFAQLDRDQIRTPNLIVSYVKTLACEA